MDLRELKKTTDKYFNDLEIEFSSDIVKENDYEIFNLSTHVAFKALGNLIIHMNVLAYPNGATQITFNFGKCVVNDDLLIDILHYNIKTFGYKPVIEYDELRFYNQAFYKDAQNFIYNLDMTVSMFLSDTNVERLKDFTKYLAK